MRPIILVSVLAPLLALGCETAQKGGNTQTLGQIQEEAVRAEQSGSTRVAINLWSSYVERRPQEAFAQYSLGRLQLAEHSPQAASDHLWIAHDLRPGNLEYLDTLAEALYQSGERDKMFQLLRDTLEEGGLAEGHMRMAKFSMRAGLIDEAQESLAIAAAIDGTASDRAHRALARLARQTGDTEAEINAWRTVLWFDVNDAEANTRLSQLGEIPGPSLILAPRTDG